jgi:type IV pilus assembly protein PilV
MIGNSNMIRREQGFSMLEVLLTVVIVLVGVLGLAGLIVRSQHAEMESYQRTQALVLLQDMVNRINANRANATSYQVNSVGTGATSPCSSLDTIAQQDICNWHNSLLGAAKRLTASDADVGAVIGARGCVFELDGTNKIYLVSVAWQGIEDTAAPVDSPACGTATNYGTAGKRRVISTTLRIANLSAL